LIPITIHLRVNFLFASLNDAMKNYTLFEATPGISLALLPNEPVFTIESVSNGFVRTSGISREEATGNGIFDLLTRKYKNFNVAQKQNLRTSLMHVIQHKEPHAIPAQRYDIPNSNGTSAEKYWRAYNVPVLNSARELIYVIHGWEDVTEQVFTERQIAERTAELNNQKGFIASILDASLHGIYALKAIRNNEGLITDFQYLFANKQIATLLKVDLNRIINASMLELLPENKNNGFFNLFCKLLETGETFHDETHFVAQQIDSWFDYAIVPLDKDTLVVSIEDITSQKQFTKKIEEQRNLLDNILRNSSNGISVSRVIRDENGEVIDALTILANDAAVKYIGLPRETYLSKKATEIEPAIIGSPYYEACIKTLKTGKPFVMQYQMESTGRWLELTVSRLDNEHLIQIFTDITPIKEAQLQLERSVEELKRSNESLEQFAFAASHDLKEPMRKIELFSNRLKERLRNKLEPEDEDYLNRIFSSMRRMNSLIDDLLMYSYVSKESDTTETIDLNERVRLVLEDLELQIQEANAVVTICALPSVKGNRRQLQQLFQNLIGNAIKYRKADVQCEINIFSRLINGDEVIPGKIEKENKEYELIEVKDNGIGFEQEHAEKIFNMFTRLHGNAEYKGTGVGLSIVEKVVQNHHGYIWAESRPGEGATFKVLLPKE